MLAHVVESSEFGNVTSSLQSKFWVSSASMVLRVFSPYPRFSENCLADWGYISGIRNWSRLRCREGSFLWIVS